MGKLEVADLAKYADRADVADDGGLRRLPANGIF